MQALNPFLEPKAAQQLVGCAQDWQELCVLHDKILRCLKCCPGHGLCQSDARMDVSVEHLIMELRNQRSWDRQRHPGWLTLEVSEQIEIREKQAGVAQALLDNIQAQMHDTASGAASDRAVKAAIAQMNMGEGKTRVVLPMLVLALAEPHLLQRSDGSHSSTLAAMSRRHVPRLNFLDALLQESAAALRLTLTGALQNPP